MGAVPCEGRRPELTGPSPPPLPLLNQFCTQSPTQLPLVLQKCSWVLGRQGEGSGKIPPGVVPLCSLPTQTDSGQGGSSDRITNPTPCPQVCRAQAGASGPLNKAVDHWLAQMGPLGPVCGDYGFSWSFFSGSPSPVPVSWGRTLAEAAQTGDSEERLRAGAPDPGAGPRCRPPGTPSPPQLQPQGPDAKPGCLSGWA